MKNVRREHSSMGATERVPAKLRHSQSATGSVAASPAPIDAYTQHRKPAVLHTMPTIRWLLTMHRFQVDSYSDEAIADALLETCPRPDDFWLRTEHLALAVRRVCATGRRSAASK